MSMAVPETSKGEITMPEQATKPAPASQSPAASIESSPTNEEIAILACSLWPARGCPDGTPDEDWFNAEKALEAKDEA
jgi:hypothetical protein